MGLFDGAEKAKTSNASAGYFGPGRHFAKFRCGKIVPSEQSNETFIVFEFEVLASDDPAIRVGEVRSVSIKRSWKAYLNKVKDVWAGLCAVRGLDLNAEFTEAKLQSAFAEDCVSFEGTELEIVGSKSAKPMKGTDQHFTNLVFMAIRDDLGTPSATEVKAPAPPAPEPATKSIF